MRKPRESQRIRECGRNERENARREGHRKRDWKEETIKRNSCQQAMEEHKPAASAVQQGLSGRQDDVKGAHLETLGSTFMR